MIPRGDTESSKLEQNLSFNGIKKVMQVKANGLQNIQLIPSGFGSKFVILNRFQFLVGVVVELQLQAKTTTNQ